MKYHLYLEHCGCYNLLNRGYLSLFNCAASVRQTIGLLVSCVYISVQCGQLYYLSTVVLIFQEESEVVGKDSCGPWNCCESNHLT